LITEKTSELVEALFQSSFLPLFNHFIENNRKFNRFYHEVRCSLVTDEDIFDPVLDVSGVMSKIAIAKLSQIDLRYHFSQFKGPTFGSRTYTATITILFHPTSYTVSNGQSKELIKKYTQPLRSTEIKEMVTQIANEHKKAIEEIASSK
jgi:hypothetical protein